MKKKLYGLSWTDGRSVPNQIKLACNSVEWNYMELNEEKPHSA